MSQNLLMARRYAAAFLSVVQKNAQLELVMTCILELQSAVAKHRELQEVLKNPRLRVHRLPIFLALANQLKALPVVLKLLEVLDKNDRLRHFVDVVSACQSIAQEQKGVVVGHVYTAQALNQESQVALVAAYKKQLGKEIQFNYHVNPDLLGGVMVQIQDQIWDASVRTQLQTMQSTLRGG